jgi:hypothetical protein
MSLFKIDHFKIRPTIIFKTSHLARKPLFVPSSAGRRAKRRGLTASSPADCAGTCTFRHACCPVLCCTEVSQQTVELGHEPPRLQKAGAAERPLIADTIADEWRGYNGPSADMPLLGQLFFSMSGSLRLIACDERRAGHVFNAARPQLKSAPISSASIPG